MLTLAALALLGTAAAAEAAATEPDLVQYGAIGLLATVALAAGWKLFARQIQIHERDIARADRAEEALDRLNELVRDRLVVQLTQTADAVIRVTELMSEMRHEMRRKE